MNYMMNHWLMYQTIVCRIWGGRAGFYQVGGAFGARDQMQDAINAIYHMPDMTRKQILRNCKHQYREGDIQHWWHQYQIVESIKELGANTQTIYYGCL